jgi:hypothetical protein
MLVKYPNDQIIPLPKLLLFHDIDDARKFLAGNNQNPEIVEDCPGQCICIEGGDDTESYCVIVLSCDFTHHAQTCGVIAHEAYHATCFALEQIGENEAGEETTAYVLQAITASLVHAHAEYMAAQFKGDADA